MLFSTAPLLDELHPTPRSRRLSPPDSTIRDRDIMNGAVVVAGVLAFSGATCPVIESHLGLIVGGDL